jgi:DNA helicase-2/ATP-dependent DNA helicase PcrA
MMLNEQQLKVVHHPGGPLLVLACPGSGKTRCITERIIKLLDDGVKPSAILAVTFTNKAAEEMGHRVKQRGYGHEILICTFHALATRLLRKNAELMGYKSNFTIIDDSAQTSLFRRILKSHDLNPQDKKHDPKRYIKAIEDKKNNLLSQEEFEEFLTEVEKQVFRDYQTTLKKSNAMDFGDLIYNAVMLFRQNPEVAKKYATRFQHILVDEMQDTNQSQLEMIKHLTTVHNNIIVVGDEDQMIYSWRGACPQNILGFDQHFTNADRTLLEVNYRCTPQILQAASRLIANNSQRHKKDLQATRGDGQDIKCTTYDTPEAEAERIAELVNLRHYDGYDYKDIAILCRTNSLTRMFEECFRRKDIPYVLLGTFGFYDRKEVKSGLAFMRFLGNTEDALAFEEIVNIPPRGIGPATVLKLLEYAEQVNCPFLEACKSAENIKGITSKAANALVHFVKIVERYDPGDPYSSLVNVFEDSGFLEYIRITDKKNNEHREDNVNELLRGFASYCNRKSKPSIDQYLQEIMLLSSSDDPAQEDAVRLMTIHAAKGLEFGVVFIPGMEEEVFPHKRAIAENSIEEERRVCYVAVTRAKDHLYLSRSNVRGVGNQAVGTLPSRFLVEMGLAEDPLL